MTNVSKLDQFLILVISKTDKTSLIQFVIFHVGKITFVMALVVCVQKDSAILFYKSISCHFGKESFCNSHVPT